MAEDDFPNLSDSDIPPIHLSLSELRDMARGDLDETLREGLRQQWRPDARYGLQAVSLSAAAPTLASGNVASQIPLFSQKETDAPSDFEAAFSNPANEAEKTAHQVGKSLLAFFGSTEFDATQFDIVIDFESGDVTLDLSSQFPVLEGAALVLHFATAQGAEIDVVVSKQAEEEDLGDAQADKPSEILTEAVEPSKPTEAENVTLPEGLLVKTDDIVIPTVLPPQVEATLPAATGDDTSQQLPRQSLVFAGDDFGRIELTPTQAREQIFFADRQEDALEARFVRDDNGVKFVVTLDGIAEQTASIFAYVPVGSDVSIFDSSGAPVSVPDAVYVYGDGGAVLSGGVMKTISFRQATPPSESVARAGMMSFMAAAVMTLSAPVSDMTSLTAARAMTALSLPVLTSVAT